MKVELISWTRNPIETIAEAASACYDSEPSTEIVKQCVASGHESVIEHTSFTFKISGISRAAANQLVRHRIASYSQRSQRYCSEDEAKMVVPPSIQNNPTAIDIYNKIMDRIKEAYQYLQALEIPNEDARFVLPNACETIIYVTMNLRTLGNFFGERLCSRSQWEIRKMAQGMKKALEDNFDNMELDNNEREVILSVCVPKCEKGKVKFCPEHKSCGRQKTAQEIKNILQAYSILH
jgi:thymidylate synthase (FAD)